MKSKYRHILFDLDHTLWDFDTNSRETLIELYASYQLENRGFSPQQFVEAFIQVNRALWDLFNLGKIDRDELRERRFKHVFESVSPTNPVVPYGLNEDYIANCPNRSHVFPGAHETLSYLKERYFLHILTNGFHEIQFTKLQSSRLDHFFTHIVTSKESGAIKPEPAIFDYILKKAGASPMECIMVGDDLLADIGGARAAGIDQVFFNSKKIEHTENTTFEISDLRELMKIL